MKTREALLGALLCELERTRRRRVIGRRIGAGAAIAAMVALAAGIAFMGVTARGPAPRTPTSLAQTVTTDPGVLARFSVSTADAPAIAMIVRTEEVSLANIEMLDDQQLCAVLASIGRPAGIVRSQGRVWLTQNVTDPRPDAPG